MTEADYRRLLPHVSALPAQTALNVNTASAPVLASLADGLSLTSARSLQTAGGREGYRDLAAFSASRRWPAWAYRAPAWGLAASFSKYAAKSGLANAAWCC